jgi:hypothetical protein
MIVGYRPIADIERLVQPSQMADPSLSVFQEAVAELHATRPPVFQQTLRRLSEVDFASVHADDQDLLPDLVLRLTADCIVACHELTGPARVEYRQALELVSRKLNVLARREASNSELVTYLSKFDLRLAEFGE